MSKVQLTGAFARFRGKLNRSESLVFKGCPCCRWNKKGRSAWLEHPGTDLQPYGELL